MRTVAVLGSGEVGDALAAGFLKYGDAVVRGTRDPAKLEDWRRQAGPNASVGTFAEAARRGELVVLAVKGGAAESVIDLAGADALQGKVVIDTTNPIADAPPVHGVLKFFTSYEQSLLERLQRKAPGARFVKAFSCVGSDLMVDPAFGAERPTMFLCGNDAEARREVSDIARRFGHDVEDCGEAEAARAIEPLAMLWCIPGLRTNQWTHALRMLRK